MRETVDLGLTVDERIADGYYYSGTMALVKKLLAEPELLEEAMCHIGRTERVAAPAEAPGVKRGARVRHAIFGEGEVIGLAQEGRAYIIQFDSVATPRTLSVQAVKPA